VPAHQHRALEVDGQDPVPAGLVDVDDAPPGAGSWARDPEVVDQHVEPAVALHGAGDRALAIAAAREVRLHRKRLPRFLLDLRPGRVERCGIAIGQHHVRALAREQDRGRSAGSRPAAAPAAAGDDRDFSIQPARAHPHRAVIRRRAPPRQVRR
jgi:hypothetical protein